MRCAVLFKVPWLISTHVCLQQQPCFWGSTTLTASSYEPGYRDQFRLGLTEKFQHGFRDGLKANDPGDEFWQEGTNKADMQNTKIINFAPIIAFATLKAVSLQLTGMFMMRKTQQAMQDNAIWARIHPAFIPVTGLKCSYGKISSPLSEISVRKTEISGTEPARPLIWTHRKFYKGFRGEATSRKPGQPGWYEEALNPGNILHLSWLKVCLPMVASTV